MMNFTDYLVHALLDHSTAKTPFTVPAASYIGLFTADPTASGSQSNEVSGGSYARKAVTWGSAADRNTTNNAAVETANATASWGTVTHFGILDALTTGNMLFYGVLRQNALAGGVTVSVGESIRFEVGDILIVLT